MYRRVCHFVFTVCNEEISDQGLVFYFLTLNWEQLGCSFVTDVGSPL